MWCLVCGCISSHTLSCLMHHTQRSAAQRRRHDGVSSLGQKGSSRYKQHALQLQSTLSMQCVCVGGGGRCHIMRCAIWLAKKLLRNSSVLMEAMAGA